MAHPYKSACSDHRKEGHSRYKAEGGQVVSIPFSLQESADALKRLQGHGVSVGQQGKDFAASRLKAHGVDPVKTIGTEAKYKKGGWIKGAIKHPGALHRDLGVPQGQKIPASKLAKAAHSSNPTLRRRANLAKTLKGMHK